MNLRYNKTFSVANWRYTPLLIDLQANSSIQALNYYLFGPGTTDKVMEKYEAEYAPDDNENWATTFSTEMTHLYFICPSRALARQVEYIEYM